MMGGAFPGLSPDEFQGLIVDMLGAVDEEGRFLLSLIVACDLWGEELRQAQWLASEYRREHNLWGGLSR